MSCNNDSAGGIIKEMAVHDIGSLIKTELMSMGPCRM